MKFENHENGEEICSKHQIFTTKAFVKLLHDHCYFKPSYQKHWSFKFFPMSWLGKMSLKLEAREKNGASCWKTAWFSDVWTLRGAGSRSSDPRGLPAPKNITLKCERGANLCETNLCGILILPMKCPFKKPKFEAGHFMLYLIHRTAKIGWGQKSIDKALRVRKLINWIFKTPSQGFCHPCHSPALYPWMKSPSCHRPPWVVENLGKPNILWGTSHLASKWYEVPFASLLL